MYAVIESGGKQHRVVEGEILQLDKLNAVAGDKVKFDKILLVGEGESVKLVRLTSTVLRSRLK